MSIDNSEVKSKYFDGQSGMDESLSDFQETKKSCKGPKPAQNDVKPKRKVTKRIKGQKDIRTALKGKKNDLISYSKEFDTVCKKSGLDIDSEQLQLAIALSKSLQTASTTTESSETSTSKDRTSKIRKTLQEYGFKVPEAKITKRTKKLRKHYKLLTITEEERHQKITGKYSQILFDTLDITLDNIDNEYNARVFNLAANLSYKCMKDNNIFYIHNLIEKSTTNGSLLRDWSEIPGRPISPVLFDVKSMDFNDIDCSQVELDIILSGSMKSVKDIFATKQIKKKEKLVNVPKLDRYDPVEVLEISNEIVIGKNVNNMQGDKTEKSPEVIVQIISPVNTMSENKTKLLSDIKVFEVDSPIKVLVNNKPMENELIVDDTKLTIEQQYRSCSPDIFDDELSSIIDITKPINILSQEHKTKLYTDDNFMDLTQCANVLSQKSDKSNQLSQNITKRKSNDLMEMTECVVGSSQPICEVLKEIDLTQSPPDNISVILGGGQNCMENEDFSLSCNKTDSTDHSDKNIADQQNCTVINNKLHTSKENIDLTQNCNEDGSKVVIPEGNLRTSENEHESVDLTQSSNSTIDDLPLVEIRNSQSQSLNETIIMNEEEFIEVNGKVRKSIIFTERQANEVLDLTQAKNIPTEYDASAINHNTESCSNSFYEEFNHDHSENTDNSKVNEEDTSLSKEHSAISKEAHDIDLTQSSDSSVEISTSPRLITKIVNIPNNSSLGKRDDISIDYDEIVVDDDINNQNKSREVNDLDLEYGSSKSDACNDLEIVDDCDVNSSQKSEGFHISDKELDYSLHKSRHDIPRGDIYFCGKTVLDSVTKTKSIRNSLNERNDSIVNRNKTLEITNIAYMEGEDCVRKSIFNFPRDNFDFGGISVLDNVTKLESSRQSVSEGNYIESKDNYDTMADSFLPEVALKKTDVNSTNDIAIPTDKPIISSPVKNHDKAQVIDGVCIQTPKNSEYIIKTNDVTPLLDYASMSTPQRNKELNKYGLKPFKRKRAIKILTHLYNQTHPTIQQIFDEQPSPSKKRRLDSNDSSPKKVVKSLLASPLKKLEDDCNVIQSLPKLSEISDTAKDSQKSSESGGTFKDSQKSSGSSGISIDSHKSSRMFEEIKAIENVGEQSSKTNEIKGDGVYEVTTEVAVIKEVDCSPDDWVFQKREKAKVHSCRVPLHIAFHNYVSSRRPLREAILKYEPVNIDVIHKDLVGYGHRYDPKDLLKFLDKKCITVKTTDNNSRNKR